MPNQETETPLEAARRIQDTVDAARRWSENPVAGVEVMEHPAFGEVYYARQVRDQELEALASGTKQIHLDKHGGYWSMSIPSLSPPVVKKAVHALKLMAGNSGGMVCTYIDTPEVVVRFDFKKRVINERWPRPCRGGFDKGGLTIVSANDPDAAIGTAWHADSIRPIEEIETDLKVLQGELVRFSYRGLNIWVKPARNDALMRHNCNDAEWRARGLLREMIGPEEFQNYLRRGFIVCKGRTTGHLYIIRGGHSYVDCMHWNGARFVLKEKLCVQFRDSSLPHTDAVIMRKLFVENDEITLRHASNISDIANDVWQQRIG